jgi:prepilin-type N-terminal cleavage/methylation domain-containing protein
MRKRSNAGFTLLEVAIAIFVLAATATIFVGYLPTAMKTGKMVGNHQQASSLVQHKVDQLRGVGYGRLTYVELRDAGIIDEAPTTSPYNFKQVDGLPSFFVNPVATVKVEDYTADIRKVTVTLTWTGSAAHQGDGTMQAMALIAKG